MSNPTDEARRRVSRRLFFGLPLVAGALAARPHVAQAGTATSPWKMEGNSDVDDNDFIGSINDKSLVFKTKNLERMRITNTGRVGINSGTASATLQVGALATTAIRGESVSTEAAATGVWGQITSASPPRGAAAVRGIVPTSPNRTGVGVLGGHGSLGVGVCGISTLTAADIVTGDGYSAGVVGLGATGVLGVANPWSDGGGTGVVGQGRRNGVGVAGSSAGGVGVRATSSGDYSRGVEAEVDRSPGASAVFARVVGSPPPPWGSSPIRPSEVAMGVRALGPFAVVAEGATVGVYGASSDTTGYAAYFLGRVQIEGSLQIGGGDSEYSLHYVPTTPERTTSYSGNVVLDGKGAGVVVLTIDYLRMSTDVRYQLTPVGSAAPGLHIAQELDDQGRFVIAGGTPGQKVSWRVETAWQPRP